MFVKLAIKVHCRKLHEYLSVKQLILNLLKDEIQLSFDILLVFLLYDLENSKH